MLKTVSLIAAAAVLAGAAMLLPAMTPEAAAVAPVPAAKSDRADNSLSCERQGWPYYEANCLRDESRNAGRVPQVRIITTDRVSVSQPATPAVEPLPHLQVSKMDASANPFAVPAWPEYLAELKVLAVR
jgi:hypothetical protein